MYELYTVRYAGRTDWLPLAWTAVRDRLSLDEVDTLFAKGEVVTRTGAYRVQQMALPAPVKEASGAAQA